MTERQLMSVPSINNSHSPTEHIFMRLKGHTPIVTL